MTLRALGLVVLAGGLAAPAWAQTHPHLLFTASDVPALQQRATTTHASLAQPFLDGVNNRNVSGTLPSGQFDYGDPRENADLLLPVAMAAVLQHDAAHVQLARDQLDAFLSWSDWEYGRGVDIELGHFITAVALTYDWLNADLSATERSSVVGRLTTECDKIDAALANSSAWWVPELMQNHNWIATSALGECALALEGDLSQATTDRWLGHAIADLTEVTGALATIHDGSWHEGPGYLTYGLERMVPFLEMLKQVKGTDLTDFALLRGVARYRAAELIPGAPREYLIDTGDTFGWSSVGDLVWSTYAASRFRDPIAQAYTQAWIGAGNMPTYVPDIPGEVFAFLFFDPAVTAVDLRDQPLDQRFDDQQSVIFRSDRSASPLMVALKTGPYTGEASFKRLIGASPGPVGELNIGHNHADDNGFYLYANGEALVPEAAGYNAGVGNGHPPAQQSRYHNTLLVDGNGQAGEEKLYDTYQAYPWAKERSAGISRGASTEHYAFATGDGAHLYHADAGLSRFDRQLLLVDRRYAVVRDVIAADFPHTFTQAWHFKDGATATADWIEGVAKNGQEVAVRVLEPQGFAFATAELTPDQGQHTDPDGNITEADVSVPAPVADARLLSLFWPTTATGFANRPTVVPLSATPGAGFVLTRGAHVDEVLLHDAPTDHSVDGDLELTGLGAAVSLESGALQHLLLLEGTRLVRNGALLVELPVPGTVELAVQGGALLITGEGVNVLEAHAPGVTQVLVNGHPLPFGRAGDTVIVPPPGVPPGDASTLSTLEHPTWRVFDQTTNPTWNGTGGWPTGSSSSGGTSGGVGTSTGGGATTGSGSGAAPSTSAGAQVKGKGCSSVGGLQLLPWGVLALGLRRRRR